MAPQTAMLAAGGTGGHLFPAEALAHELRRRGWNIELATDSRAAQYAEDFPADHVHIIPSATIESKHPFALLKTLMTLWRGFRVASKVLQRSKPAAVIGFGGYPTLPPVFAATRRGVPTLIHEQNAVMGRANKALAGRVDAIAGGFLGAKGSGRDDKIVVTGNPVRPAVLKAAERAYEPPAAEAPFRLLVFGGSQGAQFFSDTVPPAFETLDPAVRMRIRVVQQAREEDEARVRAAYAAMGIYAEVSTFFDDMAERMAEAHLVVSRSGASTVSEIAVVGRPAILVPYPYALDHDQAANAAALAAAGGAELHPQQELTSERLSGLISGLMDDPQRLTEMAVAAKSAGKPDAARLLADLTEAIASGRTVSEFREGPPQ